VSDREGDCRARNLANKGNDFSRVKARRDQVLISITRLWKVLKRVEERERRWERRMVGKRMILVLM
jgi:hypothetical protein